MYWSVAVFLTFVILIGFCTVCMFMSVYGFCLWLLCLVMDPRKIATTAVDTNGDLNNNNKKGERERERERGTGHVQHSCDPEGTFNSSACLSSRQESITTDGKLRMIEKARAGETASCSAARCWSIYPRPGPAPLSGPTLPHRNIRLSDRLDASITLSHLTSENTSAGASGRVDLCSRPLLPWPLIRSMDTFLHPKWFRVNYPLIVIRCRMRCPAYR